MKQREVIITGSGGQGILYTGLVLANAANQYGKFVTWFPSYGAEKRGGIAHCTVIISDDEVSSPIIGSTEAVVALDRNGYELYGNKVRKNGILIINSSFIKHKPEKNDIKIINIPASKIAEEAGSIKATNIVALGAYLEVTKVLPFEIVISTLREFFKDQNILDLNLKAFQKGIDFVK